MCCPQHHQRQSALANLPGGCGKPAHCSPQRSKRHCTQQQSIYGGPVVTSLQHLQAVLMLWLLLLPMHAWRLQVVTANLFCLQKDEALFNRLCPADKAGQRHFAPVMLKRLAKLGIEETSDPDKLTSEQKAR